LELVEGALRVLLVEEELLAEGEDDLAWEEMKVEVVVPVEQTKVGVEEVELMEVELLVEEQHFVEKPAVGQHEEQLEEELRGELGLWDLLLGAPELHAVVQSMMIIMKFVT
jgi:hypothetical protein